MKGLLLHAGAHEATLEEAAGIALPEQTDSYMPLPHNELIDKIDTMAKKLIGDVGSPRLALSKDGQKMFGIMPVLNGNTEYNFTIGFRNSYDKSMAAGICFGTNVFVCDNLAFSGEITILRKHTTNIHKDLTQQLVAKFMDADTERKKIYSDYELMKSTPIKKINMARALGEAAYKKLLNATQFNEALRQVKKSNHFPGENGFALYNHGTHALKSSAIHQVIQKSADWHNLVMETCQN